MTTARRLLLVVVAALPLAACDTTCPTQNPKIADDLAGNVVGVPATCTDMKAGTVVTVKLGVCPRCDETYDSCTVTLPQGDNIIQLDPLVQVCDANPSCPLVPGCNSVTCTFTAPAPTVGGYQLLVYDPATNTNVTRPFITDGAGAQTSCGT